MKKKVNITPLFDNIIIKIDPTQSTTGLIIPETIGQGKSQTGTVVRAGEFVEGIRDGDRILFEEYTPQEVVISGEKYHFLKESNILCVIEKE